MQDNLKAKYDITDDELKRVTAHLIIPFGAFASDGTYSEQARNTVLSNNVKIAFMVRGLLEGDALKAIFAVKDLLENGDIPPEKE